MATQAFIMIVVRGTRSSHTFSILRDAALLGMLAIGVTTCSTAHPTASARLEPSCLVGAAQAHRGDTISVAMMAAVDWTHAPTPTNDAEGFAFAQVYETLIDIDCEGHARPALATSWTLDATKSRVTLSLRRGAMFWSGKPLTADDVLAAWRRTAAQSTAGARVANKIASGTTIIDDHTLIVSLPDTAWMVLASPALAIYEQQATARWPEGSGPYRIAEQSAPGGFALMPLASQATPYLVSRRIATGDARDAIDAGIDVLVTDDPVAVGYASAHANLMAVPLPWTRTYAIALPVGSSVFEQPDFELAGLRASLARDAVHVEARGAQPPYWWQGGLACGTTVDSLRPTRTTELRSNRVVYLRDDAVARGLAERFVAIERHSVAVGLPPNDFARALRDGGEVAYVLDLPRVSFSSCQDFGELRSAAPWLGSSVSTDAKLVPLIDTRETAIVNRNRVAAAVDWNGTLHFGRP